MLELPYAFVSKVTGQLYGFLLDSKAKCVCISLIKW